MSADMSFEEKADLVQASGKGYTWTQTVSEVVITIPLPKGTAGKQCDVQLEAARIRAGLKGQPAVLDGALFARIDASSSVWSVEDRQRLVLVLQKQQQHLSWASVVRGVDELDALTRKKMDDKMMLEKFQNKHAGFDFSGAEITGNLPANPATFLDDIGESPNEANS